MAARRNVLETMEDCELIKRYRQNREGIKLVVELVRDGITSPTNRNNPISPEIKCLAKLQYLTTGKMQLCNADDLGISQPSVSGAINQTINALSRPHIIQQFIRFPLDNQQLHRIKANFMAMQVVKQLYFLIRLLCVGETVMKDGGREDPVSRHEVFEDYVNFFFQQCPEVGPCRDPPLLRRVARYLQTGEPAETFPLLPVHRAVLQGCDAPGSDCRKHLSAVSKAAELLETLCLNLFLQPWKKEIRTLKTYTGQFVYHLLPVLSSSTIQSVLASIGYLPHTDTALSEYRLSEEADPQRAQLLGFQLLLARVECSNLLELLERLGPQEWLDVLQRKAGPKTLEENTEENTTKGQKEEEEEEEEEEIKKEEEADRREDPQSSANRLELKPQPQPKPRRSHLTSVDQSILEMHKSYPDLSIKGRRLVPHRAPREDSRGREGPPGSTNIHCDEAGADGGTTAAAPSVHRTEDGLTAEGVMGEESRGSGCSDRISGGSAPPGDALSSSTTDGGRGEEELSGPLGVSLHITLRAGSKGEQSLKPGDPQATAEHSAADLQNKTAAPPKLSSLSSLEEGQMLKELRERMGQLSVQETSEEGKGRHHKREEDNTEKERRRKERKASTEGGGEEQTLRTPLMEPGPAPCPPASSQLHPAEEREHPPLSSGTADCQVVCAGETGRGGEEELAQSFVIL